MTGEIPIEVKHVAKTTSPKGLRVQNICKVRQLQVFVLARSYPKEPAAFAAQSTL